MAILDTSVIKLSNKLNRLKDFEGLYKIGSTGKRDLHGFHISPVLVYGEQDYSALGISSASIVERKTKTRKELGEENARYNEPIENKESYKWLKNCIESKQVLQDTEHVTFIMDREADIIELLDRIPDETTSLLVRSNFNRNIINKDGSKSNIKTLINETKVKAQFSLKIKTSKRKPRTAILDLKYESAYLKWPEGKNIKYKQNPKGIKVTIIDVREHKHKGHKDEPPLHWRLISSEEIKTTKEALKQVEFYKNRWKIEEFFKLLKTDGYDIEATELTKGKSIRKLTLLVMKASIKVLKLKAARDRNNKEKIEAVFDKNEIECIKILNKKLEGNTEKQKNPHDYKSLSFASWVIARLGGWKEFYNVERPPGSKTFIQGLEKFDAIMIGFNITNLNVS